MLIFKKNHFKKIILPWYIMQGRIDEEKWINILIAKEIKEDFNIDLNENLKRDFNIISKFELEEKIIEESIDEESTENNYETNLLDNLESNHILNLNNILMYGKENNLMSLYELISNLNSLNIENISNKEKEVIVSSVENKIIFLRKLIEEKNNKILLIATLNVVGALSNALKNIASKI